MKQAVRFFVYALVMIMSPMAAADEFAAIKKTVAEQMNGAEPTAINQTGVEGLYEVIVPPRVLYMSKDARYVFLGDLIDLKKGENVTENKRANAREAALARVEDSMIIFKPEGKTEHTVTVFTDIDCGYCRRLHAEMDKYNEAGIAIRYMAYPRAGIGSESYQKAVNVWCAEDRQQALTAAKNGEPVPNKTCDNPVAKHFQIGQILGVSGTPALVLENGQRYPGYVPAARLKQVLDQARQATMGMKN
jgi:thiol:disulfide interchange protein DsbC